MSFLLTCPVCGLRAVEEFGYHGEVTRRPVGRPSLAELGDYLYFRANVAGEQREWWHHRLGCGAWFLAHRDTRTNSVVSSELPTPSRDGSDDAA
jgi:heterotetrameric sarcosine oxidase delta subunit